MDVYHTSMLIIIVTCIPMAFWAGKLTERISWNKNVVAELNKTHDILMKKTDSNNNKI